MLSVPKKVKGGTHFFIRKNKNLFKKKGIRIMKKAISLLSAFLIILTVMCNVNVMASAAVSVTTVKTSHLKTVFSVPNYRYDTALCTNIGGISVGTANNRLFVVKSNSTTERRSTLYYYNNPMGAIIFKKIYYASISFPPLLWTGAL